MQLTYTVANLLACNAEGHVQKSNASIKSCVKHRIPDSNLCTARPALSQWLCFKHSQA